MPSTKRQRITRVYRELFFWLTSILLIFFMILYGFVSDRTAWGEWVTIWPSFFWVLGLLPMSLIAWEPKRRLRSLVLFAAIALFLITTLEWRSLFRPQDTDLVQEFARLHASAPAPGRPIALRIVSWNINSGSGGNQAILDKLAACQPDLCFLQETPDGSNSFQPGDLTGYWAGFNWRDEGDCGILSRYPITPIQSRRIGPWTPPLVAQVNTATSISLLVVNVRLMLPSLVLNPLTADSRRALAFDHAARLEQNRSLSSFIAETMSTRSIDHVVLAGDFNTPAGMKSLAPLRARLLDAWPQRGRGWGATMTNQFPVARIDQCWVTPNIRIADARVLPGAPSDHRMLVLDFIIDP